MLSKEQVAERRAFVLEQFKANPKASASEMKKITREKFGAGLSFYHCRELKKEARASKRADPVKAALKKGTKKVSTAMVKASPLFMELANSITEGFGDCQLSLVRDDNKVTAQVQTNLFKAEWVMEKKA